VFWSDQRIERAVDEDTAPLDRASGTSQTVVEKLSEAESPRYAYVRGLSAETADPTGLAVWIGLRKTEFPLFRVAFGESHWWISVGEQRPSDYIQNLRDMWGPKLERARKRGGSAWYFAMRLKPWDVLWISLKRSFGKRTGHFDAGFYGRSVLNQQLVEASFAWRLKEAKKPQFRVYAVKVSDNICCEICVANAVLKYMATPKAQRRLWLPIINDCQDWVKNILRSCGTKDERLWGPGNDVGSVGGNLNLKCRTEPWDVVK